MKAPDKIYIDNFSCYAIEPRESDSIIAGKELCYIRKDTLLEWAKEKHKEYTEKMVAKNMDETHWGQRNAFQQMIDKLNSL